MPGRSVPRLPTLLRPLHSDEYLPVVPHAALARATAGVAGTVAESAGRVGVEPAAYLHDPRATALALVAIDDAHGGGFYAVGAEDAFVAGGRPEGAGPVVDVQTHLVDASLWTGPHAAALGQFLRLVDPERWSDGVDPHAIDAGAWAALVFGASETAVALLTSTPGPAGQNVLENAQIAAVRDVTDRYAGTGRVLTHTIVHPNLGPAELDRMAAWSRELRPSAWKVYTLAGPPTAASPTGGWFLDDEEIGYPFLERVRALGPRIVCAHKGLGGPVPGASVAAASPRDVGPAAAAFPDVDFVVYHSGYERDPDGAEAAFDPIAPSGVDRLIVSCAAHGIGRGANVWAELGSTWFLVLRRPVEAAHVLGKLLVHFGPERILWGTDSTWYGSPQPLIDAFCAFTIPERMQDEFGYPALTDAMKDRILGANAAALYGLDVGDLAAMPPVADAGVADELTSRLLVAIDAARV
ncbi:MAG: amidohydrolase family protein [Acidimicrobiia bacterium]